MSIWNKATLPSLHTLTKTFIVLLGSSGQEEERYRLICCCRRKYVTENEAN